MAALPAKHGALDGVVLEGESNESTALSPLLPPGFLAAGEGVRQEKEEGEAEQMSWLSVSSLVNMYLICTGKNRTGEPLEQRKC